MATKNKGNCVYFKGDRPCKFYWIDGSVCWRCHDNYKKMKERILLIKLDVLGDVLRTTPVATGLKKNYPNSHLTWLVKEESYSFLKNNPYLDDIKIYNNENIRILQSQKFDILINLDKAEKATSLLNSINAKKKLGFGMNEETGHLIPLNKGAEYHYKISTDNWRLKRQNKKNFQEMMFDSAELLYNREEYVLNLDKKDLDFAKRFYKKNKVKDNDVLIGLNTGCGQVYPHKKWTVLNFIKLVNMFKIRKNYKIVLFGGPSERKINKEIKSKVKSKIIDSGTGNTLIEFAALIKRCNLVVAGDTAAMHIAIALKVPVVAVFGPTPYSDIDVYNKGVKIVADLPCLYCYDQIQCVQEKASLPNCMERIKPRHVFDAIQKLIKYKGEYEETFLIPQKKNSYQDVKILK